MESTANLVAAIGTSGHVPVAPVLASSRGNVVALSLGDERLAFYFSHLYTSRGAGANRLWSQPMFAGTCQRL